MEESDFLAERFEAHRTRLRTVAQRILGSSAEADDAVQEAWLRLDRAGADGVDNLGGWLTTVVSRVALNMLRSRDTRREDPWQDGPPGRPDGADPEEHALLADSVGFALLAVLDTLGPAERLAFVLHDLFAVSFEEIAPIVGRTPATARKLASRARHRVRGAQAPAAGDARRREVVTAFLTAAHDGDFAALLGLLGPDVRLRTDDAAARAGAWSAFGAAAVAEVFSGRAQAARPALVNGAPGLIWSQRGQTRMVFEFTIIDGRITAIDLLADLEDVEVEPLDT
ncbi:sigma-70 family RNA polymerase sigma factor [Actinomadura macrotermitis]|uniref:Putative ECF RNA polymerase sigma factor SigI n=1 Tax=Actinomadura macrotermitis TaxID=2585200 RepID=A0A7K0C3G5_9ACTN|nr:sigma-70 family RNA polymerase sigma factor [Actinomadura macrotermitis]MQY08017.1 putative ECF RNA polymerase sigma factor SigI [Actinomadura macrotermitis]